MEPATQLQLEDEDEIPEKGELDFDEQGDDSLKKIRIQKWLPPSSDEEVDPSTLFNVEAAWQQLMQLKSCHHVMVDVPIQKKLQIAVGENVSQEFPFKQIKYKFLRDVLFDELPDGDICREVFSGFDPENYVLIGYAPLLTQNMDEIPQGDPFIFYFDPDDAKLALTIIRNLENYERWMMNKRLAKKPRRWVTLGSENEVNLTLQQRQLGEVDVEIQSVYPLTIPADKTFALRKSTDVRDGYVELVPSESAKFDNIIRRRVAIGIQSAPELIDLGQQTDPTFPTNAFTQYLYEIKEGDEGLDETSEDEAAKDDKAHPSKTPTPVQEEMPKPPPEMSERIKFLLSSLEFNQIDMYRDDYPDISKRQVAHFTNPFLEETLCFANIAMSQDRYVCGIDWYPSLSGLLVTSYTFDTQATVEAVGRNVDSVQRAVLQPNPVLMWSFSDNLNYKLVFDSPIETTALAFCPHDSNLLFGGCKNGQVVVWDLQQRAEKLDQEEVLTSAQANYRFAIAEFLKSTIERNEEIIVPPAIITALEVSPKSAITGIYWLSRRFYINSFGKVYNDPNKDAVHKCFMTTSIDGLITFWDLDAITEKKVQGGAASKRIPKALAQNVSAFKNKIMKPLFTVGFNEPITSVFADTSVFACRPAQPKDQRSNIYNYRTNLIVNDPPEMRQSLIVSTFYGRIERLNWLGLYTDTDAVERVNISTSFARVHDGPIISMKKNPFCPNIFVTIGKNIFAVWKEDYNYSAIFWRKRISDLTAVSWSEDRPSVLFLTRIDGNLEAWDILARDGDACLDDVLGGGIITSISEHRPAEPEKLLGIGDYNSSFRMVKLPPSFYVPVPNELKLFNEYINKEESRKKDIQTWEQNYFELNSDVIEAKRQAEMDARKEMERIEKENALLEARKAKEEADKAAVPLVRISYTERMKREWDELNLNRLLSILMTRKRVDAEQLKRDTVLEKKRLAYEAAKKESLVQTLQRVGEEVANIRARILPAEKHDRQRTDMINALVESILAETQTYDEVEEFANEYLQRFAPFKEIDYIEYLKRGEQRRQILNKSLGGNKERALWYEKMLNDNLLDECNFGYEAFNAANADLLAQMAEDEEDVSRDISQEPTEDIDYEENL